MVFILVTVYYLKPNTSRNNKNIVLTLYNNATIKVTVEIFYNDVPSLTIQNRVFLKIAINARRTLPSKYIGSAYTTCRLIYYEAVR